MLDQHEGLNNNMLKNLPTSLHACIQDPHDDLLLSSSPQEQDGLHCQPIAEHSVFSQYCLYLACHSGQIPVPSDPASESECKIRFMISVCNDFK